MIKKEKKWKPRNVQRYGIPYMGSKHQLAKHIFNNLPSGNRFVDLFGGGGAMTHYGILNHKDKYKSFLYNDINPLIVDLFKRTINGWFNPSRFKPHFITKEEYESMCNLNGYIAYIWSFGNNPTLNYIYGESYIKFKEAAHNYIVFGDEESLHYLEKYFKNSYYWHIKNIYQKDDYVFARKIYKNLIIKLEAIRVCVDYGDRKVYDEFKDLSFTELLNLSNKDIVKAINLYCPDIPKKKYKTVNTPKLSRLTQLQELKQLERLQHLERLERLQQLEEVRQFNQLEITIIDYHNFKPETGDVIYCDIPYNSELDYDLKFDYKEFCKWAMNQEVPIYYSYYYDEDNVGDMVWIKKHKTTIPSNSSENVRYECLMVI